MILHCPACFTPMVMMVRYDTEIDYCPSCRGVWLDRGELEKLMTREATWRPNDSDGGPGLYPPPAPTQARKKEGFLSRVFDFD